MTAGRHEEADWPFVQNGAVTLFRRRPALETAVEAVRQEGYSVQRIDCRTEASLIADFVRALRWEDHFGYVPDRLNINALNDALRYEPCETRPRLVLVLEGFDDLADWGARSFEMLNIIEAASRDHLLHGERLLAFVQTDDPHTTFDGLGGRAARWNPKEWLLESRGG